MKWMIFLIPIMISCGKSDPLEMKSNISGYWEIERVHFPDGSEKRYSINTTIDFIELKEDIGVRKKVQPMLDGSFMTFDQNEQFEAFVRNDSLILHYTTPFNSWEEAILKADGAVLVVLNKDGKKFFYKSYEPVSLDE